MLRSTLSQLRAHVGRVVAAGIAIVLGVAFIAATLIFTGTIEKSLEDSVAAQARLADVVVTPDQGFFEDDTVDKVTAVDGVAAVAPIWSGYGEISWKSGGSGFANFTTLPEDEQLQWMRLVTGSLPKGDGQVAIDKSGADAQNLGVGDKLTLPLATDPDADTADTETKTVEVEITGVLDLSTSFFSGGSTPSVIATADQIVKYGYMSLSEIDVLAEGGDGAALIGAIKDVAPDGVAVRTGQEETDHRVEELSGQTIGITVTLLAFAAVALFVAAIVISNTFSILVAQRSRQLALLRCVGATKAQVRRATFIEALIVSVVASVVGVLVGVLVATVGAYFAGLGNSLFDLGAISISPSALLVPILVGVVVTLLAAWAPARKATKVPPLAALSPVPDAATARRIGIVRLIFVCLFGGFGTLVTVLALISDTPEIAVLGAVVGGLMITLSVILGGPLLVPLVARGVGGIARSFGVSGKLAVANAVRNPARAAATSSALLIGVWLIVLLGVGAATGRLTANEEFDRQFPLDASVTSTEGELSDGTIQAMSGLDGISESAELTGANATVGGYGSVLLLGMDPADAERVLHSDADEVQPGTALVSEFDATNLGVSDGQQADFVVGDKTVQLTVQVSKLGDQGVTGGSSYALTTKEDVAELAGDDAPTLSLWLRAADGADYNLLIDDLNTAGQQASNFDFGGSAPVRAQMNTVLDIMLLVVTALLGVAVVIAVVGIANTLGLSVLERTRESALLRALGLTKQQMRGMIAVEAALLALVGALLGIGLGILVGFTMTKAIFAQGDIPLSFSVPWDQVGLVLLLALVAGLLASLLPARRAGRVQPAAALADE